MTTIVYEATVNFVRRGDPGGFRQTTTEHATLEAAKSHVETSDTGDGGKVITWVVSPNLPRCLPALVYRSCALTVYHEGKWHDQNIHG